MMDVNLYEVLYPIHRNCGNFLGTYFMYHNVSRLQGMEHTLCSNCIY